MDYKSKLCLNFSYLPPTLSCHFCVLCMDLLEVYLHTPTAAKSEGKRIYCFTKLRTKESKENNKSRTGQKQEKKKPFPLKETQAVLSLFYQIRSHCVVQADLELLTSRDPVSPLLNS